MTAPSGGGALGVGIVVVSHSRALATAAVDLAREMVHGSEARIAVAAGLDETTFGTDAVQIAAAIQRVGLRGRRRRPDGSGQRGPQRRTGPRPARRRRRPRPGAAVPGTAGRGPGGRRGRRRRGRVAAGGRGGGRGQHCSGSPPTSRRTRAPVPPTRPRGTGVQGAFTVENTHGLHARPAARLVGEVRRLDAVVRCGTRPPVPDPFRRAASAGSRRSGPCAATSSRSPPPDARRRRRSTTCSHWPAVGSTRPTRRLGSRPGRAGPRGAATRGSGHRHRSGAPAGRLRGARRRRTDRPPGRRVAPPRRGHRRRPPGHRPAACLGGASTPVPTAQASSTPTSCCWTTPSSSAPRGSASTTARRPLRHGRRPRRWSSSSGPRCPTPTCAPARPTSGPSPTRCCVPSPARRPSRRSPSTASSWPRI